MSLRPWRNRSSMVAISLLKRPIGFFLDADWLTPERPALRVSSTTRLRQRRDATSSAGTGAWSGRFPLHKDLHRQMSGDRRQYHHADAGSGRGPSRRDDRLSGVSLLRAAAPDAAARRQILQARVLRRADAAGRRRRVGAVSSIQAGAWSLALASPRISRSTPASPRRR